MPYTAEENRVADHILTKIRAIGAQYNAQSVILVPAFVAPPSGWARTFVEVRTPQVAPYGMGGGAYLMRLTCDIAVFRRKASDSHSKYEALTTQVNETARTIRSALMANANRDTNLAIPMFDSGHVQQARILETQGGGQDKEIVWVAFQLWGVWGQTLASFAPDPD